VHLRGKNYLAKQFNAVGDQGEIQEVSKEEILEISPEVRFFCQKEKR